MPGKRTSSLARVAALVCGLIVAPLRAGDLLVSRTRDLSQLAYGGSVWTTMTADLNAAAGGVAHVTTVTDLSNLNQMLAFTGLWVDLREIQTGTLTAAESANLAAYLSTGRRAVLVGENAQYTSWDASILAVMGGTYSGATSTGSTPRATSVPLTVGVPTLVQLLSGVADAGASGGGGGGGTSLFVDRVATLWGPARNALVLLDANALDDDHTGGFATNAAFANNVAAWATGGASDGAVMWNVDTAGEWSAATNWSAAFMPSSADDAVFTRAAGAAHVVSVTNPAGVVVRNVLVPSDRVQLQIANAATLAIAQSITIGQTTGQLGVLTLDAASTADPSTPAHATASSLTLGGAGVGLLVVDPAVALTVTGNATIALGGSLVVTPVADALDHPTIVHLGALTFSGNGAVDLGNNELLIGITPAAVRSALIAASIRTSSPNGVLGYMPAANGNTEVRFTVAGDTNLDGHIDVTDLGNLAGHYGATSNGEWVQGDFNYDGAVDVTDLGDLASHYGGSLAGGSAAGGGADLAASVATWTAVVPEPGSLAVLLAPAAAALATRRRRGERQSNLSS